MKQYLRPLALSFSALFLTIVATANVRLPAIIGNHMVLQQNSIASLWGWSDASEKITIRTSWDTTTYTTTATPEARWQIALKTPAAGGPHRITIQGNNKIELEDVMIGEVWLCSGQSNMEWSGDNGLPQTIAEMPQATQKEIRFFHVPRTTSRYPQDDVKAQWVVCNPDDMKRFSAIGYFFGKELNEALRAPVGLINASWGGTPAEVWTPESTVAGNTELAAAAKKLTPQQWWPIRPGASYNGMIVPLAPFNIAGVLWYQGESNVGTAATYTPLFSALIENWRQVFGKQVPFYFVQIAPYSGYGKDNMSSALLREAQTATLTLPRTGIVVTTDLVDNIADIHPKMKREVAHRLAQLALGDSYGQKVPPFQSPRYSHHTEEKGRIRIHFSDGVSKLTSKGGAPTEFYIAGDDRKFYPAVAKIEGKTVVVLSKQVTKPVAVRFAFTNAPQPNLYGENGLPVVPFRTDKWNDVSTTL
jgi:sialate O-acetylesterase